MAVTVLLDLQIKPDDIAGSPAVLRSVLTDTRNFDGNLGVEVHTDLDDPGHVVVVERWESDAAVSAYQAWRATPDGASSLGTILAKAPSFTRLKLAEGV